MAKDPAFLFYSGDFLTGVTGMNMEERGQYITLLCLQHAKGHLTLELINRSVPGLSSYVLEKFQQDEEGLYFNQRLEEEAIKRNKFCKSRSENRKGKENKDMINICETYDKHMENENINDNSNVISNGSSIVLSNNKEQSLQKKSSKEVEKWNDLKIGTKVPDRDHTIMRWDDFLQYQSERGRRSCEKLDAPMVFLSDKEYNKLKEKYKSDEIVIAMIRVMNNWKGKRKFAHQRNLNDYLAIDDSWVLEKAEKELRILNGTTVDKIRKQEAMKAEIQKNMGGISFEQ